MRCVFLVFVCVVSLAGGRAEAATRTVCSSGCQYTDLQAAIDAAVPGDTIRLRAGQTFRGNFVLRNKNTPLKHFITIRSDAADSSFPAAGERLIPEGKAGWNTSRRALARLVGVGGTGKSTPVVRTAPGAHHYRLQFLEIDGTANLGYETLVAFGTSTGQTSLAQVPHSLAVDRVWLHGHVSKGMKRGIYLNSRSTDILGSYFDDFFSFSDSQAIGGTNGPGPYRIINNHLEAAGENIMFGGDDPHIVNLVPSDIVIRGNYLPKDLKWRHPILKTPSRPTATASSTSGSLAAGKHYFTVTAVIVSGGGEGCSAASAEAAVTVTAGRSVRLSWRAVAGADKYRIYRGRSSNGLTKFLETAGTQSTFTYTGKGEQSGTPRWTGRTWTVKNLLELKNAQRVTIDGNVLEYNWQAAQQGYAILFTPRNQSGRAPWSVVRDVTFTNNTVRHVAAGVQVLGRDYLHPSQPVRNITIRNNLFENLDSEFGNTGRFLSISEGPINLTVDHNTIDNEGAVVDVMAGAASRFVFTNNIARHNAYGVKGQNLSPGAATISSFFPGAVIRGNVLAGGSSSAYPSGNFFPATAEFLRQFVNASKGDWRLASTSPYNNKGTDGRDIGAYMGGLEYAQNDDDGATPALPANRPPVAIAGGPYTATAGSAFTVNGSGSTDAEAPLVRYDWHFGEDIVLRAADVPAANLHGRWRSVRARGAAGGVAIENPDASEAKKTRALATPANYVEITFEAGSGVPYWIWLRMKADGDASSNDSLFVQFARAVNASGAAIYRTGTMNGMAVVLEKCKGAGRSGWGWRDGGWCAPGGPIYFQTAGRQTIRLQQREDGVMFDQVVISADAYAATSPGLSKVDTTIVPRTLGADTGITARHTYRRRGTYPIRLWVTDSARQERTAMTTVSVK